MAGVVVENGGRAKKRVRKDKRNRRFRVLADIGLMAGKGKAGRRKHEGPPTNKIKVFRECLKCTMFVR